jgi:nucleoside-diphosphate-sugar epimerase
MADAGGLTVAVTGPTGTFGLALMPLLQEDDRVDRVIAIARRPFDPAERGWTKMEYRRGDVRDAEAQRCSGSVRCSSSSASALRAAARAAFHEHIFTRWSHASSGAGGRLLLAALPHPA